MKRILTVLLCLLLLLTGAACAGQNEEPQNKYFPDAAKPVLEFEDQGNVIICWGDDATEGVGMKAGFTYPEYLQEQIGSQFRVINAGVSREESSAVLSRANAREFVLTSDAIFDKGEKQYTMDRYMCMRPNDPLPITYRGFGNQLKMENVIVGGKKYTLEFEVGEEHDNGIYRLTRKDASKALTIKAGTKVRYDYSSQYKKVQCNIILMGANESNQGAEVLIEKYKKLTALNENYIVIVPFHSEDFSAEFTAAFGDKALNVRDYFMYQAHKDYGVTLSKLDGYCIKKEMIPGTYNYEGERGDYRLNEIGYKILGDLVYKKGQELGYWK